jgi:hypothetical protein
MSYPGRTTLEEDLGGARACVIVIAVLEDNPHRCSLSRSGCATAPMPRPGHTAALWSSCRSSSSVKIRMGCGEDRNEGHEVLGRERRMREKNWWLVVVREDKNEYAKIRTHNIMVGPGSHGSGGSKNFGFALWTPELHRARDSKTCGPIIFCVGCLRQPIQKMSIFCVDWLRRTTPKIGAHFLYQLKLLIVTIKKSMCYHKSFFE